MISYKQIEEANSKLSTIQLGTGGKKKDYVMVPQRVKAFRMLYPEGFILTDIISHENNLVVMQAKAGYYNENGEPVVLGSGLAFEERGKGMVNGTSYIENCETSAVGRALGFLALGIDGGGICSAEELVNAITAQEQNKAEGREFNAPKSTPAAASMTTVSKAPPIAPQAPATPPPAPQAAPETPGAYLQRMIKQQGQTYAAYGYNFMEARAGLIQAGLAQDVPSATMTMEQAKSLIQEIGFFYDERKRKAEEEQQKAAG